MLCACRWCFWRCWWGFSPPGLRDTRRKRARCQRGSLWAQHPSKRCAPAAVYAINRVTVSLSNISVRFLSLMQQNERSNSRCWLVQMLAPSVFSEATKSLTIVVPAYNEEARLPSTLDETLRWEPNMSTLLGLFFFCMQDNGFWPKAPTTCRWSANAPSFSWHEIIQRMMHNILSWFNVLSLLMEHKQPFWSIRSWGSSFTCQAAHMKAPEMKGTHALPGPHQSRDQHFESWKTGHRHTVQTSCTQVTSCCDSLLCCQCRYLQGRRDRQGPNFTYEVIVVDDGSMDATVRTAFEYVRKHGVDAVRVLQLPRNYGKVRRRNQPLRGCLKLRVQLVVMCHWNRTTASSVRDIHINVSVFKLGRQIQITTAAQLCRSKLRRVRQCWHDSSWRALYFRQAGI